MALKTILKLLISKFGLLSVEMQNSIEYDQTSGVEKNYIDSPNLEIVPESNQKEELKKFIETEVETLEGLESVKTQAESLDLLTEYDQAIKRLTPVIEPKKSESDITESEYADILSELE